VRRQSRSGLPIPHEMQKISIELPEQSAIQYYVPKGSVPRRYKGLVPFVQSCDGGRHEKSYNGPKKIPVASTGSMVARQARTAESLVRHSPPWCRFSATPYVQTRTARDPQTNNQVPVRIETLRVFRAENRSDDSRK